MKGLRFIHKSYAIVACITAILGVAIFLFVDGGFIRFYIGDVLVVIFLYASLQSIFRISPQKGIIGVVAFACIVEALQYMQGIVFQLRQSAFTDLFIGHSFDWWDIVAYLVGGIFVWCVERLRN